MAIDVNGSGYNNFKAFADFAAQAVEAGKPTRRQGKTTMKQVHCAGLAVLTAAAILTGCMPCRYNCLCRPSPFAQYDTAVGTCSI